MVRSAVTVAEISMAATGSVIAIIPARGGSRGLPGKHLRRLGGLPLIAHTVRAACSAGTIDRVLCSTDDDRIGRAAVAAGAEVPFRRPAHLATDEASTTDVVVHAVEWLEGHGTEVRLIVTLQPTSPLRTASQIDAAVGLLDDPSIRSSLTVTPLGMAASIVGSLEHGRYLAALTDGRDPRRQAAPPAVRITGGVYVTRRDLLMLGHRMLDDHPAALLVDAETAVDIDTESDLREARSALRRAGGAPQ
jgi:CMP-N-acetylneuraminic acid synthetase